MKGIWFLFGIVLMLLLQSNAVYAQSEIVGKITVFTSHILYSFQEFLLNFKIWFYENIILDSAASDSARISLERTRQYHEFVLDKYKSDGKCCRPLRCLQGKGINCPCKDCNEVRNELDRYWRRYGL